MSLTASETRSPTRLRAVRWPLRRGYGHHALPLRGVSSGLSKISRQKLPLQTTSVAHACSAACTRCRNWPARPGRRAAGLRGWVARGRIQPVTAVHPGGHSERRPGRGAVACHVRSGLPSVHLLCRTGDPACDAGDRRPVLLARLPRHASRGWSRVGTRLPCPDVLWSVTPLYDGSAPWKDPGVINSLS